MLSDSQLKLLAETVSNVGVAFLVSIVLPVFGVEAFDTGRALIGLAMALISWIFSLLLVKNIKT